MIEVSVVVPFYKNIGWLKTSLSSVLSQTFQNYEILVINDGSKEDLSFVNELDNHKRIKVITQKNGGPASARNRGIESAKGRYVAFLDSDDYWESEKLEKQIEFMKQNNYICSHHHYRMFYDDNTKPPRIIKVEKNINYINSFKSSHMQTSCVIVDRKFIIDNNIKFPLEKRFGQDFSFFIQIAKLTDINLLEECLGNFRIHGKNAGFRPSVQLKEKAYNYKHYILKDEYLSANLASRVVFGYKLCYYLTPIYNRLEKFSNSYKISEMLAGIFYSIPYLLIKT
ncbi:glycosyltransferase family 2 protein [Metabacillus litoralis]|uniref:glycosyltransferase family 2 protein n=1 Tax=Metabacillus litoralis TaxID=152268 RepID=UPI00203F95A6|nr:glycosyltransferase family 2 protein [Metabacillus litoralis]MCM3163748.1 glycosyltransferase family 2 protein [Metabacillus litoralis]